MRKVADLVAVLVLSIRCCHMMQSSRIWPSWLGLSAMLFVQVRTTTARSQISLQLG